MFDYLNKLKRIKKPDGVINTLLKQTKKRAKTKDLDFNLDVKYLLNMWNRQDGKCALTKIPFFNQKTPRGARRPFYPSIDRKDNNKGYVKGNVRIVLVAVNMALFTWGEDVFDLVAIERFFQIPGDNDKGRLIRHFVEKYFGKNYVDAWIALENIQTFKNKNKRKINDGLISESRLASALELPNSWFSVRRKNDLDLPPSIEVPRGNRCHRYYDLDESILWFKNNKV